MLYCPVYSRIRKWEPGSRLVRGASRAAPGLLGREGGRRKGRMKRPSLPSVDCKRTLPPAGPEGGGAVYLSFISAASQLYLSCISAASQLCRGFVCFLGPWLYPPLTCR